MKRSFPKILILNVTTYVYTLVIFHRAVRQTAISAFLVALFAIDVVKTRREYSGYSSISEMKFCEIKKMKEVEEIFEIAS